MKANVFRALLGLLLGLSCLSSQAAAWQTDDLMTLLAQNKKGHATFIEKKYIGIIDKPIESSGELFFTAPDRLEKRTLKPKNESMLLDGQRLIIERAGKAKLSLNLQNYPEASAFIESIRGTLAGDKTALEKVYFLSLNGSANKWQLILQPKFSVMSDVITRISISGVRSDVNRVEFDLADGDRAEMLITQVVTP